VGVGELDLDPGAGGDALAVGHLLPLSQVRVRVNQAGRAVIRAMTASAVMAVREVEQGGVAGGPLDDGAYGGVRGLRAHDEVALMVAGDQAALHSGGPLPDRDRADDLAPPFLAAAAAGPDLTAGAQAGLQFATRAEVDRLVDRLVT
jgi:hypothetical protein